MLVRSQDEGPVGIAIHAYSILSANHTANGAGSIIGSS